jgi:hypothetical protein
MAIGSGKYDYYARVTREAAQAEGVILIVIKGDRGSGFSVQATMEITSRLPEILRDMADQIEDDIKDPTA